MSTGAEPDSTRPVGTEFSPFDVDLAGTEALREEERFVLLRLLATGTITEVQASEAIAVHRRTGSPLLDILGASGALRQREYAAQIAAITNSPFGSPLVGTDALAIDPELARRFSPAVMMRFLFFPLAHTGSFTTVLAVNPDDPAVTASVQEVLRETEVIALAATERDITRLMDNAFQAGLTYDAVHGLRSRRPEESASRVFTGAQVVVFAVLSLLLAAGLILDTGRTVSFIIVATSILYTAAVAFKGLLAFVGALEERQVTVTDEEIAALDERDLPVYSVLVPVYREPAVVPTLLAALRRLDYPLEKLDVLLLVEEDDEQAISAARAADPPPFFRFIYIPASQPRTKPKACNYGLAFCRGELVTIYDAEDIPRSRPRSAGK